jgi:hypothetical protein
MQCCFFEKQYNCLVFYLTVYFTGTCFLMMIMIRHYESSFIKIDFVTKVHNKVEQRNLPKADKDNQKRNNFLKKLFQKI